MSLIKHIYERCLFIRNRSPLCLRIHFSAFKDHPFTSWRILNAPIEYQTHNKDDIDEIYNSCILVPPLSRKVIRFEYEHPITVSVTPHHPSISGFVMATPYIFTTNHMLQKYSIDLRFHIQISHAFDESGNIIGITDTTTRLIGYNVNVQCFCIHPTPNDVDTAKIFMRLPFSDNIKKQRKGEWWLRLQSKYATRIQTVDQWMQGLMKKRRFSRERA